MGILRNVVLGTIILGAGYLGATQASALREEPEDELIAGPGIIAEQERFEERKSEDLVLNNILRDDDALLLNEDESLSEIVDRSKAALDDGPPLPEEPAADAEALASGPLFEEF